MNLERDTAPTGFYNNLPRFRKTRSVIGPLKKGLLKKVGYDVTKSRTRRRSAVSRAVKKYGRSSTIKKLNAIAVLTRRTSPAKSKKFKADMRAAQKMKGGDHELDYLIIDINDATDGDNMRTVTADLVKRARAEGVTISDSPKAGELINAIKKTMHDQFAQKK